MFRFLNCLFLALLLLAILTLDLLACGGGSGSAATSRRARVNARRYGATTVQTTSTYATYGTYATPPRAIILNTVTPTVVAPSVPSQAPRAILPPGGSVRMKAVPCPDCPGGYAYVPVNIPAAMPKAAPLRKVSLNPCPCVEGEECSCTKCKCRVQTASTH